jgi:K+-sensing histidine kinase KdpD
MKAPTWMTQQRVALAASVLAPLVACAILSLFRSSLPASDAALVLVVVIVAIAALGSRLAGILAAISSAIWFDFFLVRPYHRFSITSHTDIETTVLLLVVGIAVTELAIWGRHQRARAQQQDGYLAGLHAVAEVVAVGGSPTQLADRVSSLLIDVLGLSRCSFHFGTGAEKPRLQHDGTVTWGEVTWDVDHEGFPLNEETELIVSGTANVWGRFLMTPLADARPTLTSGWLRSRSPTRSAPR